MDDSYDVPDSTDWLNTPLKEFSTLENTLHCQICKEFYDTPMITSCNHTFCSKCIRTSLSADGKCPACRTSDQASKLRSNWALQEVVSNFVAARPAALAVARKAQEETEAPKRTGKRKRATVPDNEDVEHGSASGRTLRSKSRRIAASQESQTEPIEIEDSEAGDDEYMAETEPDDGLVGCPLGCGKRMKEPEVFNHLDRCEDEKKQASKAKSRAPINGFAKPQSLSQNARPQDRINELNYSMLKDSAFSKKLKEIGIANWGSKQLMTNRHKEWVNIWNANCDSTLPRPKRELLKDLETWERTQGGRAPNANGPSSAIMRKDFDQGAYARRHQDEFSRLIADARRKKSNSANEYKAQEANGDTKANELQANADEGDERSPFFDGSNDKESVPTRDRRIPSLKHSESGDPKPYENNPEAIASIREKVEAINNGKQIKPLLNEGFKNPEPSIDFQGPSPPGGKHDFAHKAHSEGPPSMFNSTIVPASGLSSSQRRSESAISPTAASPNSSQQNRGRQRSQDEHIAHSNTGSQCDIPAHLLESPTKVPMFAVPSQPVRDIDGGGDTAPP